MYIVTYTLDISCQVLFGSHNRDGPQMLIKSTVSRDLARKDKCKDSMEMSLKFCGRSKEHGISEANNWSEPCQMW